MRLLFEHATDLIDDHSLIPLYYLRKIHEGIVHFTRSIHCPRCFSFPQETLHTLADDGTTGI